MIKIKNLPPHPSRRECKIAAALLTRGLLKARPASSDENLQKLLNDRRIAEAIMSAVEYTELEVYDPLLAEFDLDFGPQPIPADRSRGLAKVTAFSSRPEGRVAIYLVLHENPERTPEWGVWRLDEPSCSQGTVFPFFRLGDFESEVQILESIFSSYRIDLPQIETVEFVTLDKRMSFLDLLEHVEEVKRNPDNQHVVLLDANPPQRIRIYSRTKGEWQCQRFDGEEVVLEMAIYLFDKEAISMREAASLTDLSLEEFMEQCGARRVPIIRLDAEELEHEFRGFPKPNIEDN